MLTIPASRMLKYILATSYLSNRNWTRIYLPWAGNFIFWCYSSDPSVMRPLWSL